MQTGPGNKAGARHGLGWVGGDTTDGPLCSPVSVQRRLMRFKVLLNLASAFLGWVTAMIRVIYEAAHSSLHFNNPQSTAAKIRF